jgi:SAM-dependent methyltransferase
VRPALHVRGAEVLECGDCGLRFWRPAPGFRPGTLYDAAYFASCEAERGYDDYASLESSLRRTFARRLRALPPPRDGARLLDVGAAFGFAVAEARRAGWRAVGLEVSPAAARRAAAVGPGVQIVGDAARLPFPAACFEALTLWDVIEHLPDPHAAVAEAARVLRPGGRLALTTGDVGSLVARLSGARWHLYTLPEHLFFHTRESLRRLVAAHGLRVLRLRADAAWYTLGYLAERLRKTLLPRGAKRPARWPGARLAVPVNLFDVVTLEALRE